MPAPAPLQKVLPNGMTVLIEPMQECRAGAVTLLMPAGTSHEPSGKNGTAALLSELMLRGAGPFDSRELSIRLDNLGVQHNLSPGWFHLTLSAATVAHRLPEALDVLAQIIRAPRLEVEQFERCLIGRDQVLRSIEDEPKQKLMIELRRRCYAPPWNRPVEGTLEQIEEITLDDVRSHYQRCCVPDGAILGIAGFINADEILAQCERLFGDWQGTAPASLTEVESQEHGGHLFHESTQTHIGIAYPSVPLHDPDYYKAWATVSILSGGMSSRLFTKVREERGLCYAIGASMNTLREKARVLCYAGTTNERAQETLDVTLHELQAFGDDITASELQRCQARAKSSLIMQEDSTMARSGSLVRDWFHLGRVTSLEEIRDRVEELTVESVTQFARDNAIRNYQVLTIGPNALNCPGSNDISHL